MKEEITKIIIALIIFIIAICIPFQLEWINIVLYIISYIIVGGEIVLNAIKNVFKGKIFDENFLMSVATIGAISIGEYPEAVAVMLFYQIGEIFQDYAVDKSRRSITSLMDIRPDYANIKVDGNIKKVNPNEVAIGDLIVIKPGEKIPLDGIIKDGKSFVNTSALTGESVPREVRIGDAVLSGYINQNGLLTVEVTKKFEESTASKVLKLVENATNRKAKSENFITKFAKIYTPIVVVMAILLAILPPFILKIGDFNEWLYRALSFLVVSCPCALVISIPLGFFGGIGGASKMGILVKGSNYLEALAKTKTMVFDKTGTLTQGIFEVQKVNAIGVNEEELLKLVTYAENYSNHPISVSLKKAYGKEIDEKQISKVQELTGLGIEAVVDNKQVLVGNSKLMKERKIEFEECTQVGTVLYVAINEKFSGTILISDKIKEDAKKAIENLKKQHITKTVMLTGDKAEVAKDIAKKLNIDEVHSELLPDGKVKELEKLLKEKSKNSKLSFVGDGINDSPVLALSDIGIAMGGLGSDSAIEAADVVIMNDEPSKISSAIQIAKKTVKIVKENIIFAIGIKVVILVLTAIGISNMWQAVFADVGVSIIAILNSLRALNTKS